MNLEIKCSKCGLEIGWSKHDCCCDRDLVIESEPQPDIRIGPKDDNMLFIDAREQNPGEDKILDRHRYKCPDKDHLYDLTCGICAKSTAIEEFILLLRESLKESDDVFQADRFTDIDSDRVIQIRKLEVLLEELKLKMEKGE